MAGILHLLGWLFTAFMALVTLLLAFNRQTGLALLQHRVEMLPQAMLVRYGSMSVLALLAAWFNAPRILFAMLLAFAVTGLGDAFVYRRAGHPFWLHLVAGGGALAGALLALLAIS